MVHVCSCTQNGLMHLIIINNINSLTVESNVMIVMALVPRHVELNLRVICISQSNYEISN